MTIEKPRPLVGADENLATPVYIKAKDAPLSWPEGVSAFYVLSSSGLFLCRNHPLFRSCVPARGWPSELAPQERRLDLGSHLRVPRAQLERIVGFFARVGHLYQAEAAALLLWDRDAHNVKFVIPPQRATVSETSTGYRYPRDVSYQVPQLPPQMAVVGDIHCHVDGSAFASATDQLDESYRAGLHVVVGRIDSEPPEFHCEYVVDGQRFQIDPAEALEGYRRRRNEVPEAWLERVEIDVWTPTPWTFRDDYRHDHDDRGHSGSWERDR